MGLQASKRSLIFACALSIASLFSTSSALQYVSGGQCASVCATETAGTLESDVRCLDREYTTEPGLFLKQCVTCQLNSTAVDPDTKISDVEWALFNLRYSLSNCMFAYPIERVSISSPCQVSCAPLRTAIISGIQNDTSTNDTSTSTQLAAFDFCKAGQFDDTTINNCAFCYSFIPQQLFLGNFLQALHIACRSPPEDGKPFYPDGKAIFNASAIAGPTGPKVVAPASGGLKGYQLILAIVLPIVGAILILVGVCACCWHFTRKRRASMAATGRMSRFHDEHATGRYSPMTPKTPYGWNENESGTEMERIQHMTKVDTPGRTSPGRAQGRWNPHANDDESNTPLASATNQDGFSNVPIGQAQSHYTDSTQIHEQYLGQPQQPQQQQQYHHHTTFRAQDGYVRE